MHGWQEKGPGYIKLGVGCSKSRVLTANGVSACAWCCTSYFKSLYDRTRHAELRRVPEWELVGCW